MEILTDDDFAREVEHGPPATVGLKFVGGEPEGSISGWLSTFDGEPDRQGDTFARGAFTKSIRELATKSENLPMLVDHSTAIGSWHALGETEFGLRGKGRINLDTSAGKDVYALVKAGDVRGVSVGFLAEREGFEYRGGGRVFTSVQLLEASIVPVPANPAAAVSSVKSLSSVEYPEKFRDAIHLENYLHSCGFPRRAAKKIGPAAFAILRGVAEPDDDDIRKVFSDAMNLFPI